MTVLALDVSSVCVGYAVFSEKGQLLSYGKFVLPPGSHGTRLAALFHWTAEQVRKAAATTVAVEWPFQGGRRNAYGVLMQYCGVVLAGAYHAGVDVADSDRIPARVVKRALELGELKVAKKKQYEANKRRVVKWANMTYGLRLRYVANDVKKAKTQDDVADAIAVGYAWLQRRGAEA